MELETRRVVELYTSELYREVLEPLLLIRLQAVHEGMEKCSPEELRFLQGRADEIRGLMNMSERDLLKSKIEEAVEADEAAIQEKIDERRRKRTARY